MWRKSARRDLSQRLLPRGHAEVSDTDQCELPGKGHSRHFDGLPMTSDLPRSTDIVRPARLVRFVPDAEVTGAPVQLGRIAHGPKGTFAERAGRESKP